MAGVAEAIGLVVVVIGGREILHPALDGRVGNAVPVLDAGGTELDIVPGIGFFHAGVVGDAQAEFMRFVLHGRHDVAIDAHYLDPIGAHLLERAHAGHSFGGVAGAAEHGVDENARRGDLALGALLAQFESAFGIAADIADGGDAAGEPDIQFVLQRLRLAAPLLLNVRVGVDEAGQHVLSRGVDNGIGLGCDERGALPAARHRDGVERNHVGDGVVFDHDVLGPAGRRAVAIYDHGVVDQQASYTLAAGGCGGVTLRGCGSRQGDRDYGGEQALRRHRIDCATTSFGWGRRQVEWKRLHRGA